MLFTNPIIPGFHPDPSICRVGEDYFLVTSSFEYFPGVPLFHSRDLAHWRQIGHVLTRDSQLPLADAWISGGIYAPTIRHHGGIFTMTTTNTSHGGNFIVHTHDPFGEWSDPVWVAQDGIDPSLFFDDDGTVYFTSSGRAPDHPHLAIIQSTIDIATGRILEPTRTIWDGTGGQGPEAPHLFKIGGVYYLMIAEGGTEYGHMETMARSASPWGPWEPCPRNPILSHRSLAHPIQVTGHADLVQTPAGDWFLVCLGVRPRGYHSVHVLGREAFLAPIAWDAEGWPVVGNAGRIELEMESDRLPAPHPWPAPPVRDDFDSPRLAFVWNHIRNPRRENYALDECPGWLTLRGSGQDLDNMKWPTFLGRRQCHWRCTVTALLDFAPEADGEEAGLTVFQNYDHHYEIAVVRRDGQRRLIARRRIGRLCAVTSDEPLADGPVRLRIAAGEQFYRLMAVSPDETDFRMLDEGETRYLSTEVGGRFTGVYFGLYAHGSGRPCMAPARFDWFDYEPED